MGLTEVDLVSNQLKEETVVGPTAFNFHSKENLNTTGWLGLRIFRLAHGNAVRHLLTHGDMAQLRPASAAHVRGSLQHEDEDSCRQEGCLHRWSGRPWHR